MKGDAPSFEAVYRLHFDALYRFVLANTRNRADCEEIVQETFLKLYTHLRSIQNPRAWLFRCANNLIVDGSRRRSLSGDQPECLASASPSPETMAGHKERRLHILEALAGLVETQRRCLTLREYGGLSYREIADTLGLSVDEVKVHIYRARKNLRRELEGLREELS